MTKMSVDANVSKDGYQWTQETGLQAGIPTLGAIRPVQRLGEPDSIYDVIVIGAGYAGLTAVRDLTTQGFKVLLLEARDRIGGRTWSSNLGGYPFELGGTWVHWNQPHVYREISRYGLQEDLENSHDLTQGVNLFSLKVDGKPHHFSRAEEFELMDKVVRIFVNVDGKFGRTVCPKPGSVTISESLREFDHMSIADRLQQIDLTDVERAALEGFLSITHGGRHEEASFTEFIRWWALNNYDMDLFMDQCLTYKFRSGQSNFARKFFDEAAATNNLDYLFQAPVESIVDHNNNNNKIEGRPPAPAPAPITVTTRTNQTFQSRRVICTVPLNVLKTITFSPLLHPSKLHASQQGHINQVSKIHVECANPTLRSFAAQTANPYDKLTYAFGDGTTPAGNTHLVAFGSSLTTEVHLHGEDDIERTKRAFTAFVDDTVGEGEQMDIRRVVFHNWCRDEFARGAWEWVRPGVIGDRTVLEKLRARQGNVFFASADWAYLWRGFIDGAIEDGARVAMDVKCDLLA